MTKPYHHGALRAAVLAAAEKILESDGVDGVTLRAVARDAGVSHGAPTYHFGDLSGLLSDLATRGFERFSERLEANVDATAGTHERITGLCRAYVAFARESPGLFQLMFRSSRLDWSRPALSNAGARAFGLLMEQSTGIAHTDRFSGSIATWSLVHGLSMLIIDGRLDSIVESFSGPEVETLSERIYRLIGFWTLPN